MALSPAQIKAAAQIKALSAAKKIKIFHEVLNIITDECELKAITSDESDIQYWLSVERFKPDFEASTRELLETIDNALFPSDSINKISNHFFECVIDSAGGLNNRAWFDVELSCIRKQMFMNLLGISEDLVHVESCRVDKSKSILSTKQAIRIQL